eukprot:760714-Hanusia_phi.AAC.12
MESEENRETHHRIQRLRTNSSKEQEGRPRETAEEGKRTLPRAGRLPFTAAVESSRAELAERTCVRLREASSRACKARRTSKLILVRPSRACRAVRFTGRPDVSLNALALLQPHAPTCSGPQTRGGAREAGGA